MKRIICWIRGHKFSEPRPSGEEFGFCYTSTCYRCKVKSQSHYKTRFYFRTHKEWLIKWRKARNDRQQKDKRRFNGRLSDVNFCLIIYSLNKP